MGHHWVTISSCQCNRCNSRALLINLCVSDPTKYNNLKSYNQVNQIQNYVCSVQGYCAFLRRSMAFIVALLRGCFSRAWLVSYEKKMKNRIGTIHWTVTKNMINFGDQQIATGPQMPSSIMYLNPLGLSDNINLKITLAQIMACYLTAPSHYPKQCWLLIT